MHGVVDIFIVAPIAQGEARRILPGIV